MKNIFFVTLIIFIIFPQISLAYVGPGLAIGAVVTTLLIIVVLFLLVLAIIYYPIKKMVKKQRNKKLNKK